jgi:hypothetical protein
VTIRPAVSALTIGYFGGLLQYALRNKLAIRSLLVTFPGFMDVKVLPAEVRTHYLSQYQDILQKLNDIEMCNSFNTSDPNNYQLVVKQQAQMCINMLSMPEPKNVDQLRGQLVNHCKKWDKIYDLNARQLYPELADVWDQYGY